MKTVCIFFLLVLYLFTNLTKQIYPYYVHYMWYHVHTIYTTHTYKYIHIYYKYIYTYIMSTGRKDNKVNISS